MTVVHTNVELGSAVAVMRSDGWPRLLSGLKTSLEPGETLDTDSEAAQQVRRGSLR